MTNDESTISDPETVRVDLSGDGSTDPESEAEHREAAPTAARSADAPAGGGKATQQSSGDLEERARTVAQRHLQEAAGETDAERIDNAFETLQAKHQDAREKYQEASRQRNQLEARHEQFEETKGHLQTIADDEDDDRLVLREWAAGILTGVPDGELEEVISLLEERQEQQQEAIESTAEQLEQLERRAQLTDLACHHLEGARDTLSGLMSSPGSTSTAPSRDGGHLGRRDDGLGDSPL